MSQKAANHGMLWLAKTLPLLIKELNDLTDQLQCEDAVCVCVCGLQYLSVYVSVCFMQKPPSLFVFIIICCDCVCLYLVIVYFLCLMDLRVILGIDCTKCVCADVCVYGGNGLFLTPAESNGSLLSARNISILCLLSFHIFHTGLKSPAVL